MSDVEGGASVGRYCVPDVKGGVSVRQGRYVPNR